MFKLQVNECSDSSNSLLVYMQPGPSCSKHFTTLLPNTLTVFVKKMSGATAKAPHIFSTKHIGICQIITVGNFNVTLTNIVVSFEQLMI